MGSFFFSYFFLASFFFAGMHLGSGLQRIPLQPASELIGSVGYCSQLVSSFV